MHSFYILAVTHHIPATDLKQAWFLCRCFLSSLFHLTFPTMQAKLCNTVNLSPRAQPTRILYSFFVYFEYCFTEIHVINMERHFALLCVTLAQLQIQFFLSKLAYSNLETGEGQNWQTFLELKLHLHPTFATDQKWESAAFGLQPHFGNMRENCRLQKVAHFSKYSRDFY